MVEGTNNNELKKVQKRELATGCQTAAWWHIWRIQDSMCHKYNGNKNLQHQEHRGNAWLLLTMCSFDYGLECSLVYTADNTPSYWGLQSSGMWCCVIGCGSSNIWKDPLNCQYHSSRNTASYSRGPESSAACCKNLKFCRMLLMWQKTAYNVYECNFLNTEHPSFFNVYPFDARLKYPQRCAEKQICLWNVWHHNSLYM
jgi:hypothetical protein